MCAQRLKVTVGVTGGIAAYKSVELVRLLQDAGYDPHVVMTRAAEEFLRPLTFAAITGHKVITSLWSEDAGIGSDSDESGIEHINEAQTTQALIVAPATAHVLAKFAHGLADDFLSTMYLATTAPVIMAPAMNVNMWNHPATRANVESLRARGVTFVEPGSGHLACGMVGGGRLADNTAILATLQSVLASTNASSNTSIDDLTGETILITAGGTREAIDPVRFIGNRSSGRMGFAIAEAARRRGARVILIAAPTAIAPPAGCEVVCVTSAAEMQAAALKHLHEATIVIMAAAVSDYTVKAATQKLKRDQSRILELEPTTDILRELSTRRNPGTLVIGFAAETEDLLANGRAKLERKSIDAIVVNDVSSPNLGFDSQNNAGTILTKATEVAIPPTTKAAMAERILDEIKKLRTQPNS
ncbi:bifunctional phosphopantothenoylcysteine decarboxylase/phosphopantothenate--cysteine ligase CoaBC [Edaphobacter dinghuensis]|uniref:Coenzyme A biosynthesis bifunctional protein CoaBC n=1 Tax=Edaphobacter dinghuensis TaxID=1560005 RepID=A0A917H2Y2_9BACT|nr:bifunctional phosphopantothenoylcysteine decarboxylase/phosphopantothenate--cysteine ligase CoaBC [Edaphobacter dinghuensis]GGG65855.1 peptidase ClpP [Edaphobacter dinghuensis]